MSERTGSYPLMNLAQDYGVAYGDVLLWAEEYGRIIREEPLAVGRTTPVARAWERTCLAIGHRRGGELLREIMWFEMQRWGS